MLRLAGCIFIGVSFVLIFFADMIVWVGVDEGVWHGGGLK